MELEQQLMGSTPRRRLRRTRTSAALAAAGIVVVIATSGCTTSQGDQTDNKGYVSGDGSITVIDAADRKQAPTLEGDKLGGGTLDTADYAGQVVVLNVWGAWCGECRAEAEDLVQASRTLAKDDVAFVGLDTRDRESLALSYVRRFDVSYPSLVDQDSKLLLKFYDVVSPNAIPSTLVIDASGNLAAIINGPTTSDTLVDLVRDVQKT
ncbi:MAG TPA: TlpA disulfide reductase family protein [Nocardioidaceae bacterium]